MSRSFWEATTFYAKQDVIIAGGGLMGLWTALALKRKNPRLKVTILEKHPIPTGASTRNAGFACFGSPSEILSDLEKLGEEKTWELIEKRFLGIQKTRKTLGDDAIDFDNCGGFEVFREGDKMLYAVQENLSLLNEYMTNITGIRDSFSWNKPALKAFRLSGFDAMVENRLEGGLHSGKLVQQLTRNCLNENVQIMNGQEVYGYKAPGNEVVVETSSGNIHCDRLVLASNAFTQGICNTAPIKPARGQVIVTAPIKDLALKGTFHFDEGFYYFRNIGNRVLLGGARNKSFSEEETHALDTSVIIQTELNRFLQAHVLKNEDYTIDYKWSGIMGFTEDKLPLLKVVDSNVLAVTACNGMGVALSPIIAEEAAAIINEI